MQHGHTTMETQNNRLSHLGGNYLKIGHLKIFISHNFSQFSQQFSDASAFSSC